MASDDDGPGGADQREPSAAARGSWRVTLVTIAGLLGILALTCIVMYWAWVEIGEVQMSRHGQIALGLGAGLTFLVGVVLMGLVFFSSRRGFDERAHDWSEQRRRQRRS